MGIFMKLAAAIDRLNDVIGRSISWLSTLLVVVVCFDVFTRYFMRSSSVAVQEMEWHIFAVLFLVGAAYTLKEDAHVRVDVFYSRMTPRQKAFIDLIGSLVFLIPFSLLVIYTSQTFISMSYAIQETSPDPGGLPYRFLLKAMIPSGFFLVLLQGISMIIHALCTLAGKPTTTPTTAESTDAERQHA